MKYDVVLFDLDGTLTDSEEGIINSICLVLKDYGLDLAADKAALNQFLGPPIQNQLMNVYGFSKEKADEATAAYRKRYKEKGMLQENKLYPGITDMLERIKGAGIGIMLATSKPQVFAQAILEHFHIDRYFSYIGGASMDGSHSAKGDIIRDCLREAEKLSLKNPVMIGDRMYDIRGAVETEIPSIGALYGYGTKEELAEAGCSIFADTPEDLADLLLNN